MKIWLTLFFVFGSAHPLQAQRSDADLGKAYFQGYGCVRCHTIAGEGGNYGPDLTFIGFRKKREWIDLWLKDPHGWKDNTPMPNFHLGDNVRAAIVDYLVSLKGDPYLKSRPWNAPEYASDSVKKGQALFEKAGCVGCHGRGGVGGYPNNNVVGGKIPALIHAAEGYSKEELESKIRLGVPASQKADVNGPHPLIYMPTWGQVLKDDELEALADYLISLKPKGAAGDAW